MDKKVVFHQILDEIKNPDADVNVIVEIIDNNPDFDINMICDDYYFSLLYMAVLRHEFEFVKYFVNDLKADVNVRDNFNNVPVTCSNIKPKELLFLINHGANIYAKAIFGKNMLMTAVRCSRLDLIHILIDKYDYCIDMRDRDNKTVFHRDSCNTKAKYDNLVSICKKNDLNRIYVLQEFIDIGCDNTDNDNISSSIQGITYSEAHERALENLNDDEKDDEELLRRQIAMERIPPLFNTQKGSLFDNKNLVGMIFQYINTKPLIPEWNEDEE